jgi:Xaa-Pro aminopeptidase
MNYHPATCNPARSTAEREFQTRRVQLIAELARSKLDALIVSFPANIRYLTGFTGSNALVLVWPGGAVLFTDPRYRIQASEETTCKVRVAKGPLFVPLMNAARRNKIRRLGFEGSRLSYETYQLLKENLPLGASLEPVAGLVEAQRMIKSGAEVSLLRRSALTNSEAFRRSLAKVRPKMRESDLAAELEYQMRLLGADKPAFETIVTFGPRTALPHARAAANTLANNQLLLVDVGASQDGYASDMTRMAFLGKPGGKVKRLYQAVLEAQLAAVSTVRQGVHAERVDRAARRVLRARKLEQAFVHSCGHGLGLEIHEPPRLGKGDKTVLQAGMVITIEPGAYIEGFGGVRIEDTVVVTSTGCEVLTPASKELLIL